MFVLIVSLNWFLRSVIIVLYMLVSGISGISFGIRKIGIGFLRNFVNIFDSIFMVSAVKKMDKIWENLNCSRSKLIS